MLRAAAAAAALLIGSLSAHADVLDLTELGNGNLNQSTAVFTGATATSGADSLFVGAGSISNSVCALDTRNFDCANDLHLGFTAPVENLTFDVGGFQFGDDVRVSVFDANGQASGNVEILRGGLFDLSSFGQISSLFFDDRSTARGVSYGNFTYDAIAPVPLPASLPLLLAGIGAIGFARKKRNSA